MTPETFLLRLEGVRALRPGRWVAQCPAHADKSPSLSVTVKDDGSPLFHCFSGCAPDDILAAIGLTWKDLYPDRWQEAKARALAHKVNAATFAGGRPGKLLRSGPHKDHSPLAAGEQVTVGKVTVQVVEAASLGDVVRVTVAP